MQIRLAWWIIMMGLFFVSCSIDTDDSEESSRPSFKPILGTDFFEVRRAFDNGLAYDSIGFVQVPEWHLKFIDEDSIQVYSIKEDSMFTYTIYHDHDDYFHFARESWKVIDVHPDSLLLQRLSLRGLKVDKARSNVYMRFYSQRYINDVLQSSVAELRKPRSNDTAFVSQMVERANLHSTTPDSAYASVAYAQLESNHPSMIIGKRKIDSLKQSAAHAYLYPEYELVINNAYRDFYYTFSVVVDAEGQLHLGTITTAIMPEFYESRERVIQGIIDVYLANWLDITPAHTLGMAHSSVVYLRVRGREG